MRISQNSQEQSGVLFLIKLQAFATLLKKRLRQRCFPANIAKFLREPFLYEKARYRTPLVAAPAPLLSEISTEQIFSRTTTDNYFGS